MLYNPADLEFARLNSWVELVLPWMIFLLVGAGILLPLIFLSAIFLLFGEQFWRGTKWVRERTKMKK